MANSYTSFVLMIPKLTKKEVEWLKQEVSCPEEEFDTWDEEKQQAWLTAHSVDEVTYWPDFGFVASKEGSRWTAEFFSEEAGSINNVCDVLQRYLNAFHPDRHISFEWAFTCSARRLGEFGGGAAFITAKKIHYLHTADWLTKKAKQWEGRNP